MLQDYESTQLAQSRSGFVPRVAEVLLGAALAIWDTLFGHAPLKPRSSGASVVAITGLVLAEAGFLCLIALSSCFQVLSGGLAGAKGLHDDLFSNTAVLYGPGLMVLVAIALLFAVANWFAARMARTSVATPHVTRLLFVCSCLVFTLGIFAILGLCLPFILPLIVKLGGFTHSSSDVRSKLYGAVVGTTYVVSMMLIAEKVSGRTLIAFDATGSLMQERLALRARRSSLIVSGSLFIAALLLAGYVEAGGRDNRMNVERMTQEAQLHPIPFLVNQCGRELEDIVCAITIRPLKYQDFMIYGNWTSKLIPFSSMQRREPVLMTTIWSVKPADQSTFATLQVHEDAERDVELRAPLVQACKLIASASVPPSGLLFEVVAREYPIATLRRINAALNPANLFDLYEDLRHICPTAGLVAKDIVRKHIAS